MADADSSSSTDLSNGALTRRMLGLAWRHRWGCIRILAIQGVLLYLNVVGLTLFEHLPSERLFLCCEALVLLAQWSATYFFAARPELRVSQIFGRALQFPGRLHDTAATDGVHRDAVTADFGGEMAR